MTFDPYATDLAPETRSALLDAFREHVIAVGKLSQRSGFEAIALGSNAALAIAMQQYITFACAACAGDDTPSDAVREGLARSFAAVADRALENLETLRAATNRAMKRGPRS